MATTRAIGERFVAGVVLHTGPSGFALSDRIAAAPIASLWSERGWRAVLDGTSTSPTSTLQVKVGDVLRELTHERLGPREPGGRTSTGSSLEGIERDLQVLELRVGVRVRALRYDRKVGIVNGTLGTVTGGPPERWGRTG